jgi:uncharacterized protein (TIGR04255 family)
VLKIPKKLNKCPIADNSFELRFNTKIEENAVFGIIFSQLRDKYQKTEKLPITKLPPEILSNDINLRYKPHFRISDENTIIQIGPRVLTVSSYPNYEGWEIFSEKIISLLNSIKMLDIIESINRIGLRYINIFDENIFTDVINVKITNDNNDFSSENLLIKNEIIEGDYTKIIHLSSKATLEHNSKITTGSLIDIDISKNKSLDEFLQNIKNELNKIHDIEKKEFFQLIKNEFLPKLEPEYK